VKGCLAIVGILIVLGIFIATIQGLHQHFADHADAIVAAQNAAQAAVQAQATAEANARREAEARANHERRLEWQKAHPQEYAQQLAQQRAAAAEAQRQAEAAAAQKAAEQQRQADLAERQRIAAANQPKADELAQADGSITANLIVGNPTKYVNSVVKLKCRVVNVVDNVGANADCGSVNDNSDDVTSLLLIVGDRVSDLDANQVFSFVGTVQEPTDGTNAMGGEMHFPTVRDDFDL